MHRLLHLARRFLESLRSRPLDPIEQDQIAGWLRTGEADLFWEQQRIDRRHAYEAAAAVSRARPERLDLVRAALLHDVGKRHSALRIPGRVAASLLSLAHLPTAGRYRAYLDHGTLGSADLAERGAEPIVVAFAAAHQGPPPESADPSDWAILRAADGE